MKNTAEKFQEQLSLAQAAAETMRQCNYDKHKAADSLLRKVLRIPALANEAIQTGIWEALSNVIHIERHSACAAGSSNGGVEDDVSGLVLLAKHTLMSYRLSNGLCLGDATSSIIEKDATWHEEMVRANNVKARWLRMIQAKLRDDQRVRDVLSERDLKKILKKAETQ